MSNSAIRRKKSSTALALEQRLRNYHRRVQEDVAAGRRTARSLLVILDAIPEDAEPEFPQKPYPTSAAAWRKGH